MFFGRDAQILRGPGCAARDAHHGGGVAVRDPRPVRGGQVVVSAGRAAAEAAPRRPPFLPLPIVRPERAVLTGELGLAHAIHQLRTGLGLREPMLGEIKNACHPEHVEQLRGWLEEARQAARARLLDVAAEQPAPTLVLPVDQAEELFNADAGPEAPRFRPVGSSQGGDAGGPPRGGTDGSKSGWCHRV